MGSEEEREVSLQEVEKRGQSDWGVGSLVEAGMNEDNEWMGKYGD